MEKKNIVDSLVGIIKETEEQDKMLQSQNIGWRKELRERFDWTQNTTIKGKVELEKFIQELLDKAREEGYENGVKDGMKGRVFKRVHITEEYKPFKNRGELEDFLSKLSKEGKWQDH